MSASNISGPGSIIPGRHFQAGGTGEGKAVTGEWNGLQVVVANDAASLLADAAEELTFGASETVEKDVADRKKPEEKQKRIEQVVPPEEAMAQMQRNMQEKLAKLLAALRASGGNPAAFRAALDGIGDATEKHAALCWLEEQLAAEPSLRDMVRRERETIEAESAGEIQAGYNIAGLDAEPVGGGEAARDAYRRTVLGHGDVTEMLEAILAKSEEADFLGTVDFLRKAVGADLSAANPSTDKRDLEAMNNDLYHLRALANFTREFEANIGKLRDDSGLGRIQAVGVPTLRLLCKAKNERLPMLDGLALTLGMQKDKNPTYDVRALTMTYDLAHKFPAKLFSDEDARQRLLTGTQKLLDAAIDLEESLLEEE